MNRVVLCGILFVPGTSFDEGFPRQLWRIRFWKIFKRTEPNLRHVFHISIHDLGHVSGGQPVRPLQTHRVTELEPYLSVLGVQSDPVADEILAVLRRDDR